MSSLTVTYDRPGCADGIYKIKATGGLMAVLHWGKGDAPLAGWTAIAYIPLRCGAGAFRFDGGRAIPPEATHVTAVIVKEPFSRPELLSVPIPPEQRLPVLTAGYTFRVMSDLHLARKKGRVSFPLSDVGPADALLLVGDLTNSGTGQELSSFGDLLREKVKIPVFSVPGNHDFPLDPAMDDPFCYYDLQESLLRDAESAAQVERGPNGAYRARMGFAEILGLHCVTARRKFKFPEGQLDWLDRCLNDPEDDERWHIILCHAPLIAHNPQRSADRHPYLNKDTALQSILDRHRNILFISGHVHITPQDRSGLVETDAARNHIYLSDGSICPGTSKWTESIIPENWTRGTMTRVTLTDEEMEIQFQSLDGQNVTRGYYRFCKN